jgi:hypothetical protein
MELKCTAGISINKTEVSDPVENIKKNNNKTNV